MGSPEAQTVHSGEPVPPKAVNMQMDKNESHLTDATDASDER